ncbi:MAG TPA: quinolinate synthase NadA [Ilumatobacter sp.]|nr:quinolinate synthase NadA [Ilumatobacter sp.]
MTDAVTAGQTVDVLPSDWRDQVRDLATERDAVILAHNYQLPEIQDIAHHTGDSLGLSRIAAEVEQSTIVFCGVHFMAETAKILSPDKTVLIPDERAGCSLAETITADQLRAWKTEYTVQGEPPPVVVSYVNTTASVKAETDICCTSSNAVDVVASIPAERTVLFGPDQFLGAHVQRTLRRENMHIWLGECHVHAGINGAELKQQVEADPDADLFIHPECGCATSALYLAKSGVVPEERTKILSTSGMVAAAAATTASRVLVATETGMLHQLQRVNPTTEFAPVNRAAVCKYMKMITPAKLLRSLRDGTDVVDVPPDVAERARASVERMIAIGTPSPPAE